MKKIILILTLILMSCTTIKSKIPYCISNNDFDIEINSNDINKIGKKTIFNDIINNSTIGFNQDSNYKLKLTITKRITDSLITDNNESELQNVIFNVYIKIIDKKTNKEIYNDKMIVNVTSNISDNRFRNYTMESFIIDSFSSNFVNKLQNRIDLVIESSQCNLVKRQPAKKLK